jgi:glycerol uptake facilitator-like aquaporin
LPDLAETGWDWRIVLAEIIGTFLFTFGIAAAIYNKYEGGRQAAAIGASLFVGILAASFAANGVLNPAVAVGLNSWSVSYAVAPLVGSILGMNLYARLFAPAEVVAKSRKK